jgi:hypothetical protein
MNGRVLANAAVFVLGLVLILGGAWGIWRGSDYIQLERGWASVISGSVAATGGVLTLAIGFVLRRLDALHGALLGMAANTSGVALAREAPVAEPATEPMPLRLEPATDAREPQAAASYEPEAVTVEPQVPAADPAVLAAAAINFELLDREVRSADEVHRDTAQAEAAAPDADLLEPLPAESTPEIAHAAEPSPADGMVKSAGVTDEPELDAAIEELLAEERGRAPQQPRVEEPAPAVSGEAPAEARAGAIAPEERESAPPRAGWRGLFSRKERRPTTPIPSDPIGAVEPAAQVDAEATSEQVGVNTTAPHTETIPRTGDDWFDRALSGLDEVEAAYEPSRPRPSADATHAGHAEDNASGLEVHPPSAQEPPGAHSAEPAVIGRYTSGTTTYIMFADGSIEAETPTGILHFASLAELKVYVEGGQ